MTLKAKDAIKIYGTREGETGKALCFLPKFLNGEENTEQKTVWIPISQVHEIHPDCIVIEKWIAEKKFLT